MMISEKNKGAKNKGVRHRLGATKIYRDRHQLKEEEYFYGIALKAHYKDIQTYPCSKTALMKNIWINGSQADIRQSIKIRMRTTNKVTHNCKPNEP